MLANCAARPRSRRATPSRPAQTHAPASAPAHNTHTAAATLARSTSAEHYARAPDPDQQHACRREQRSSFWQTNCNQIGYRHGASTPGGFAHSW